MAKPKPNPSRINAEWQRRFRRLLAQGYGVEDIAIITDTNVESCRSEMRILRAQGDLAGMFTNEKPRPV